MDSSYDINEEFHALERIAKNPPGKGLKVHLFGLLSNVRVQHPSTTPVVFGNMGSRS
jgi:hypothetical protein